MSLYGRMEEINAAMEKVRLKVDQAVRTDTEMAAGGGPDLLRAQAVIDRAMVAVEDLDGDLRDRARRKAS